MAELSKEHPSWQLDLVGSCRPAAFDDELRVLAKGQGTESNVNFIRPVPYLEKEKLTARAAIGLVTYLPYANNTSCLPNKLFDYMLMGLPVIASNFPQYRKVVETHHCGLIVDPAKPEEIARAMLYLMEHPKEARQMGRNGRQAVLERYNWETESHKLLSIYKGLLGAKVEDNELIGRRRS